MSRLAALGLPEQRQPRERDRAHLAFVASLPCVKCFLDRGVMNHRSHAAHVRFGDPSRGKRGTGASEKPSDKWAVPLCEPHHMRDQHAGSERKFWRDLGVDVVALCEALHAASGDRDAAKEIFLGLIRQRRVS